MSILPHSQCAYVPLDTQDKPAVDIAKTEHRMIFFSTVPTTLPPLPRHHIDMAGQPAAGAPREVPRRARREASQKKNKYVVF